MNDIRSDHQYCEATLKKVSRTFALNITFLRGDLYKSVLYGYLFCRIADTVEDSVFEKFEDQKRLLDNYKELFEQSALTERAIENWVNDFNAAPKIQETQDDDYTLLLNTQRVVNCYLQLPHGYRTAIRECIIEMSGGMVEVLARKSLDSKRIYFSKTVEDLNKYCYYVAGTVGILLTRLFKESSKAIHEQIHQSMKNHSVSFGLGLQITNIIKDCWGDYKRGWCYIPQEIMQKHGLSPEHLFDPENHDKAQRTVNQLIQRAAKHLDDAMSYTLAIPRRLVRIRLFCLLPLFLAIATLLEAKDNPSLIRGKKVKISRELVQEIIRKITMMSLSNRALETYYAHFRMRLQEAS